MASKFGDVRIVAPTSSSLRGHAITAGAADLQRTPIKILKRTASTGRRIASCSACTIGKKSRSAFGLTWQQSRNSIGTLHGSRGEAGDVVGTARIALSMPATQEERTRYVKASMEKVLGFCSKIWNSSWSMSTSRRGAERAALDASIVRHYDGKVVPAKTRWTEAFWFASYHRRTRRDRSWAVEQVTSRYTLRIDLTSERELAAAATRHPLE